MKRRRLLFKIFLVNFFVLSIIFIMFIMITVVDVDDEVVVDDDDLSVLSSFCLTEK